VVLVFLIGLFPQVLLSRSSDAVTAMEMRSRLVWMQAQDHGERPARVVGNEALLDSVSGAARDGMANTLGQMDLGAPVLVQPKAEEASK